MLTDVVKASVEGGEGVVGRHKDEEISRGEDEARRAGETRGGIVCR